MSIFRACCRLDDIKRIAPKERVRNTILAGIEIWYGKSLYKWFDMFTLHVYEDVNIDRCPRLTIKYRGKTTHDHVRNAKIIENLHDVGEKIAEFVVRNSLHHLSPK